jgi:hypothetical protein
LGSLRLRAIYGCAQRNLDVKNMDYLRQTNRISFLVALIVGAALFLALGKNPCIGFLCGLGFCALNMAVLSRLTRGFISQKALPLRKKWGTVFLLIVKVPVLYTAAAFLALAAFSSPVWFLAGFSSWFFVVFSIALKEAIA